MRIPIGIDLGTTRTSVSMVPPMDPARGWFGLAHAVSLADGVTTPSAILFDKDKMIVGSQAKNAGHRAPDCVQIFKREMPNSEWRFCPASAGGLGYTATDLSSILLADVTSQSAKVTGLEHDAAVITVPAYFGEPERRRTQEAAERAGLKVLDIINEPTAAIVAYLLQPGVMDLSGGVLVFDLGGGTFDTVIVDISGQDIRVAAIDGDLLLGGRDFDSAIGHELTSRFLSENPSSSSPMIDVQARSKLLLGVESAREQLSALEDTSIAVWGGGHSQGVVSNLELSRAEIQDATATLLDRCIEIARRAIVAAQSTGCIPTRVLFVGGMTKTPWIRERVISELGLDALEIGADPDLLVAKGAAIWAQKLSIAEAMGNNFDVSSADDFELVTQIEKTEFASIYDTDALRRLLRLKVVSIVSRGYALRVRQAGSHNVYLDYLLPRGATLPFESGLHSYKWLNPVSEWSLDVYEDLPDRPGATVPEFARLVENVKGPMSRTWAAGTGLEVRFEMGLDQILVVGAWQLDGGRRTDPLSVLIEPQ